MRREAGAHLWDAAEATKLVHEFASGRTETEFNSDLLVRSAIERQLEVIGEALNRLRRVDAGTAGRVLDFDKIIAHEYGEIDYEIVWRAATTANPALIPILNELVGEARDTLGL